MRIAVWGKLYSKRVIENVLFPNGVFGADDYVFTAKLYSKIHQYAKIDLKLYFYRMHPNNVTMQMPMCYIMGTLKSREIVFNEILKRNINKLGVNKFSVFHRYSKDILAWAINNACSKKYDKSEICLLKDKLMELKKEGVIRSLRTKSFIKFWCFCHGYTILLKLFFPKLFHKDTIIK